MSEDCSACWELLVHVLPRTTREKKGKVLGSEEKNYLLL